jgi:hypothetical protein
MRKARMFVCACPSVIFTGIYQYFFSHDDKGAPRTPVSNQIIKINPFQPKVNRHVDRKFYSEETEDGRR